MSVPTQESLKQKAKLIRNFLNEKYHVDVSHGHCMELISQLFGFKDWNTASAALEPKSKKESLPIQIKTVGDMRRALELFDDSVRIDGEYEFKLKDFMNEVDPDHLDGIITQEFSFILQDFIPDIASFQLKLENEDETHFL